MGKNKKLASGVGVDETQFQKIAGKVSLVTIIGNMVLSALKLIAGIIANSNAMISDAVHSASDVFSTFVVIIGIRLASKKPDKEHPYGHERMECVAAIVLAMVLFITGLGIGLEAVKNIVGGNYGDLQTPGVLALVAAIVSIVSKEGMYWYTRHYAKKIDSSALMADAWHHRSDMFSSIGALIGIAGARLGFPIMDSIASLVIFLFIAKAAFDIFKDAMDKMIDRSCDEETEKQIADCVVKNEKVKGIDLLHTRIFGNKIYVDLEIQVDGSYTLKEAHGIAESVHDDIERNFPKIKHILVHVNPATEQVALANEQISVANESERISTDDEEDQSKIA
ncbi:MAG: cation diffusion facilitator family transporter [Christensenellales bacterium]